MGSGCGRAKKEQRSRRKNEEARIGELSMAVSGHHHP